MFIIINLYHISLFDKKIIVILLQGLECVDLNFFNWLLKNDYVVCF